ncbi:MAG: proton extrusion protein PcxA [Coleofasciculaceae cyanobacterium]
MFSTVKSAVAMKLKAIFRSANRWFLNTPERALDQAYKAALMIKAIEDEHFEGQKISADNSNYGDSVISYFEAELNKYLKTVKVRLAEFKTSRTVFSSPEATDIEVEANINLEQSLPTELNEQQSVVIEKLNFIDQIIAKYSPTKKPAPSVSLVPVAQATDNQVILNQSNKVANSNGAKLQSSYLQKGTFSRNEVATDSKKVTDKTGALPRSILGTVSRIQRELDPNAEQEVVKNFRKSKLKTVISIKFILTLIIVPILTQQVTKAVLVSPIVDRVFKMQNEQVVFLNKDMEREAFHELSVFQEELHFQGLIGYIPELSPEEMREHIQEKAKEIEEEFHEESANAIKNIFADILALGAFGLVVFNSQKDIKIFKSFIDDIVYGLSDSAKAFIIILFTDMFVGFHSPHGWEVILESVSRHLGLPESRNFIFLFIATFPVILDSVIKYWIFRYLNRISPSAVATYKNMNE